MAYSPRPSRAGTDVDTDTRAFAPCGQRARLCTDQDAVYAEVLAQLGAGRKRSRWMWFVFPQLAGLGRSDIVRYYAIGGLGRGAGLPGPCAAGGAPAGVYGDDRWAGRPLGAGDTPDDLKFCSFMTLFEQAAGVGSPFGGALDKYCSGGCDPLTLELLGKAL